MTKNEILNYVMTTPENVNRQVLGYMLDDISKDSEGGTLEYETGVYTSSSGTTTQYIPFTNTHSTLPTFFAIVSTDTSALGAQVMSEILVRTESLGYIPEDENYNKTYGVVTRTISNASGTLTQNNYNLNTPASSTSSSTTSNTRYWVTESQMCLFRSSSANVYGDFQWIAIWLKEEEGIK